jgi:hypothetical protein
MKTLNQILKSGYLPSTLVRAVVRRVGIETLEDISEHGADAGWPGFSYHSETARFFKTHKKDILSLVDQMADDFGMNKLEFVAGFVCLSRLIESPKDKAEMLDEIGRCLYGTPDHEDVLVPNALAWFALETVARAFCDD